MKKIYSKPLIESIVALTAGQMLAGSVTATVQTDGDGYSGVAGSGWNSHYSIWKDDEDDEDNGL